MFDPTERLNAALEGRYAIERELGEGGMATVYLAEDLMHERGRHERLLTRRGDPVREERGGHAKGIDGT